RRFNASETKEVRVYLHDGDDAAVVRGEVPSGLTVRLVGGNGTNQLVDSSRVGAGHVARLYDVGLTTGVSYGPKSLRDTLFNRRPAVNDTGSYEAAPRDFGARLAPTAGLSGGDGLGIVPRLGVRWIRYGFRKYPYATLVEGRAEYSSSVDGYRLTLFGDRRLADTRMHFSATGRMSDFEAINFHGFGNETEAEPEDFYRVRQRQWMFAPAVAVALGRRESDLTLGPVVQYSTVDSSADRFISQARPYGFGTFGQAGLRLGLRYDTRDNKNFAKRGFLVDMNGGTYPAMWDVESAFSQLSGSATTFFELPVPTHPILALRGGGRKVWGDAPFHEAAYIGGCGTLCSMDAQRYAGDASIYGTSELRVPVARVRFPIPINIGLLGFVDAGRVYLDGESPGGWHTVTGGGAWFGVIDEATGFSVTFTNSREKRVMIGTGLKF
ncbi:MAG TPA: BamA/TamA family outer membrane protein, partial [Gemmatimonadaceae bacterium]|nr:BamA/TamA family outer membrane protein [Gemmatimonadaceae bacterium]